MSVRIIADSVSEHGPRLVTLHARYPRIIHQEVMTHRVFSRNARSSRAVPVKTMLEEIRNYPFVPWHWGKNQSGMQAGEECNEWILDQWDGALGTRKEALASGRHICPIYISREDAWKKAANQAAEMAERFMDAGYHKQVANRLLEPFSYIDTLISATSWNNFFHLRDHEDAEPHFHDLASLIRKKIDKSTPLLLEPGDWHLPYISPDETDLPIDIQLKLSVARCARISYTPFDGNASIERELERYELLVGSEPLHASPTEHQAKADHPTRISYSETSDDFVFENHRLSGNFDPGWIQYRKTLDKEFISG